MTKLKLSLKNSGCPALKVLLLVLLCGCTASTKPTYTLDNLEGAIPSICKKDYNIDVKATLTGSSLWLYLPLENIFAAAKKPKQYTERFLVESNKEGISDDNQTLAFDYSIKSVPEKIKSDQVDFDTTASEKINKVYRALYRVILSMHPANMRRFKFIVVNTADIKKGILLKELFYTEDFKKLYYQLISYTEFHHRDIQDMDLSDKIIGDKEGKNIISYDISMPEFIIRQIKHRINLKFERAEVPKNADIDKEVLRIVQTVVKIYDFKDFTAVELYNAVSRDRGIFNRAAILGRATAKP